jgi:PAS domain S-box-containing protein
MPWFLHPRSRRPDDWLAEWARIVATGGEIEDLLRSACEVLRRLFGADAAMLWQLDASGERLQPAAASALEWDPAGELPLAEFPWLRDALAGEAPVWFGNLDASEQRLPAQLVGVRSAWVLAARREERRLGCALVVFTEPHGRPNAVEEEAGRVLLQAAARGLEALSWRRRLDELFRERTALSALHFDLAATGLGAAALPRLAATLLEWTGADGVAFYDREAAVCRRVAGAGTDYELPSELPLGSAESLPWDRVLQSGEALELEAAQAAALRHWFPAEAANPRGLRLVPLRVGSEAAGLALLCGASRSPALGSDSLELLSLAGAVLAATRQQARGVQTQRRWELLLEALPEGVAWATGDGSILSVNGLLLRTTGYALGELTGRRLDALLPPDDWDRLAAALQSPSPGGAELSLRWRCRSGALWPSTVSVHAPAGGDAHEFLLLIRSEVRAAAAEAAEAFRLPQAVLDSVRDGVWVLNLDRAVACANDRLAQFFGMSREELAPGISQRQILERLALRLQQPEAALARWEQLAEKPDETAWDEITLLGPRRRVLERFSRPLFDGEQRVVGRVEVFRDVTAQRLLDGKVLRRERLASIGQLLSGVAHELNNPLTAVTGYAQLLLSSPLAAAVREKLEPLAREADRAARIAGSLLDFASSSRREKQPTDLAEVVERALALRDYELTVQNISVVRQFAPALPPAWADPDQLEQVFLNLLLNAEQAIRSQRRHGRITLRLAGDGARLRAEVADDGPGVPPAILPHLFEPFATTKSPDEGTGLGLFISQAIVRDHGGEIRVESAPGRGATFIVELPATRVPAPPPAPTKGRRERRLRASLPRRVLVVDDEPAVAQLVADALEDLGCEVRVRTDSRRALADALAEPFELIICDIRMPDVDGPALYHRLRQQDPARARRLLFTTGDTVARETARFLEQTGVPCLRKPFRVEELRSRVEELLEEIHQPPPPAVSTPAG